MYYDHPRFHLPADLNRKIWRYLDFTKLVSMFETSSLFFTRSDCLSDKFEGVLPRANVQQLREAWASSLPNNPGMQRSLEKGISHIDIRSEVGLSCWHMNDYESAAMWRIYIKSDEGVAVQSTLRKLRDSVDPGRAFLVCVGEVKYIDHEKEAIEFDNAYAPLLHKGVSFEFEKEIRAVATKGKLGVDGKFYYGGQKLDRPGELVSVDLRCLIERIYVSPAAQPWFKELVALVSKRYGLAVEVVQSNLDHGPRY